MSLVLLCVNFASVSDMAGCRKHLCDILKAVVLFSTIVHAVQSASTYLHTSIYCVDVVHFHWGAGAGTQATWSG